MSSTPIQEVHKTGTSLLGTIFPRILRFLLLIVADVAAFWLCTKLVPLGYYTLLAAVVVITIFANVVIIRKEAYPLRWMLIGLIFMALFTIYPILFTIWVAFTNYGEGHLITKQQAIDQILDQTYLPAEGKAYTWTAFRSADNEYALWLIDEEGNGFLAKPG